MIKQLPQRTTLSGSSCLSPIARIKSLIQEQTNRPTQIHPARAILIQCRIVPQKCKNINNHEYKARERNLSPEPISKYETSERAWGVVQDSVFTKRC